VTAKNGSIVCVNDDNGIGLTRSRPELDKLLNNREDVVHIIDKTDSLNGTAGTRVVLTFEREKTS